MHNNWDKVYIAQKVRPKKGNKTVFFGHDSQIKLDSTFDLIILPAKFYIYTCKINKNIPQLHLFKQYLKNTFDVDKYNRH